MLVPCKPHPFDNEYHTICCALTGIMFGIDLVEGKDRLQELPSLDPHHQGNTVALLERMCQPLQGTGKIVILDSGFCILSGIILLATLGIYVAAQIKKRQYWPRDVPGEAIRQHMMTKNNGTMDCVRGVMNGKEYSIFAVKEPSYVSMMMSTYGSINLTSYKATRYDERECKNVQFHLNDVFSNHFKYRHAFDDHNHLRHQIPSIEDTWRTHHWPNCQFAFLLAISEINAYKSFEHFLWGEERTERPKDMDLHKFRKQLSFELIYNPHIELDDHYDMNEEIER